MKKRMKSNKQLLLIVFPLALLAGILLFGVLYYMSQQPHTINGTVTEIRYNCGPSKILSSYNQIITEDKNTLCDVGDSIVVAGKRISTSSGKVAADQRFSVDISSFMPGDKVTVVYLDRNGASLNCKQCTITKQ